MKENKGVDSLKQKKQSAIPGTRTYQMKRAWAAKELGRCFSNTRYY